MVPARQCPHFKRHTRSLQPQLPAMRSFDQGLSALAVQKYLSIGRNVGAVNFAKTGQALLEPGAAVQNAV